MSAQRSEFLTDASNDLISDLRRFSRENSLLAPDFTPGEPAPNPVRAKLLGYVASALDGRRDHVWAAGDPASYNRASLHIESNIGERQRGTFGFLIGEVSTSTSYKEGIRYGRRQVWGHTNWYNIYALGELTEEMRATGLGLEVRRLETKVWDNPPLQVIASRERTSQTDVSQRQFASEAALLALMAVIQTHAMHIADSQGRDL